MGDRRSAKDIAYGHVKNEVIRAVLREGDFITEGQVASVLGISRTPVREAFLVLESEGFLRLVPKKGAFVPPITRREIGEVMETRLLVEEFTVRRATERKSPIDERLEVLLEEQEHLMDTQDAERFIDCDRRFHHTIVNAAGNQVLTSLYETLRDRQLRTGVMAVLDSPARYRSVISEHRAIYEAFCLGDPEKAANAIRTHLEQTLKALEGGTE